MTNKKDTKKSPSSYLTGLTMKEVFESEKNRFKAIGLKSAIITILAYIAFFKLFSLGFNHYYYHIIQKVENPGYFYYLHVMGSHLLIWWIANGFFMCCYYFKWFESSRIQPEWPWEGEGKKTWPELRRETIKTLLFNQIIMVSLLLLPNVLLNKVKVRLEDHPSLTETFSQILFLIFCDDFCFYWSHRFLHNDYLYGMIHKQHHKYKSTVSWAAEFAHPLEFAFGNVLPSQVGQFLMGNRIHIFTSTLYLWMKVVNTTFGHSGFEVKYHPYKLFFLAGETQFHNYHHYKFKGNYGNFTIWDNIGKTLNPYYVSIFKKIDISEDSLDSRKIGEKEE